MQHLYNYALLLKPTCGLHIGAIGHFGNVVLCQNTPNTSQQHGSASTQRRGRTVCFYFSLCIFFNLLLLHILIFKIIFFSSIYHTPVTPPTPVNPLLLWGIFFNGSNRTSGMQFSTRDEIV